MPICCFEWLPWQPLVLKLFTAETLIDFIENKCRPNPCVIHHYQACVCVVVFSYEYPGKKCFISTYNGTRAGVCKTLCPQLPDSNTVWLQHCLAMTVTTVQIYDFNVILSKGNNSKIGDDWDKKKIRITYFFMRNQNMKFQNISIHGSKLMLYTIKQRY